MASPRGLPKWRTGAISLRPVPIAEVDEGQADDQLAVRML
jgi:hypothetical protein